MSLNGHNTGPKILLQILIRIHSESSSIWGKVFLAYSDVTPWPPGLPHNAGDPRKVQGPHISSWDSGSIWPRALSRASWSIHA